MDDLDALLGPQTGAPVEHLRSTPAPNAEGVIRNGGAAPQRTLLAVNSGFKRRTETAEEREARLAAKDKVRAAAAEKKRLREESAKSAEEREADEDALEVDAMLGTVIDGAGDNKRLRLRIDSNGAEIPDVFSPATLYPPSGGGRRDMTGFQMDAMDANIPVTEYYRQDRFPLDTLVAMVTQRGRVHLNQCELGFVINGAWWRKQRFENVQQLRRFIMTKTPERIEIGPVHPTSDTRTPHSALPLERYLVFDVDLEDAGEEGGTQGYIRRCLCTGTKAVCGAGCWFYMRVAVKCLVYLLRRVMGCEHILPVFSGRRGAHVWVLDETFLAYDEDARIGIVNIIKQYRASESFWDAEHSGYMLRNIMLPEFYAHFTGGQFLLKDARVNRAILEMATGGTEQRGRVSKVLSRIQQVTSPMEMVGEWNSLCQAMPPYFERHMLYRLMFPRLDENVTIKMNHPIKAPFVIHPGTKRASVPIPNIETWIPELAPRISQLVEVADEDAGLYGWRYQRQQREDGGTGAVLTSYVAHVQQMLIDAFPYRGYVPIEPIKMATNSRGGGEKPKRTKRQLLPPRPGKGTGFQHPRK